MISSRVKQIQVSESIRIHQKARQLKKEGRYIYNLALGELNVKPPADFINNLKVQTNFLRSFQYSNPAGNIELRKKIMKSTEANKGVEFTSEDVNFDCLISNGGKHALSNILGAILDPGDEVILIRPFWTSYPQIVSFCRGVPIFVDSNVYENFHPSLEELDKVISLKTKAILINSPNNPAGVHYDKNWMESFAKFMLDKPEIFIISDEIYCDLNYFDPPPTYFYQYEQKLLEQTIILDGISKSLAASGLRVGHAIAREEVIQAATKIQEQTTSGPNSLVQRALVDYDTKKLRDYLAPIRLMLRQNSRILQKAFRDFHHSQCWYQTASAFFFLIDFSRFPIIERFENDEEKNVDYSVDICEDILENVGIALGPGADFGVPNTGRISLILDEKHFEDAIVKLLTYLVG